MADLKSFPGKFATTASDSQQDGRQATPTMRHAAVQQAAMEAFFFGYQAFTAKPDEMLAKRGLSRVHHRILFFIAKYPGLNMTELLGYLGVSKQALNTPLRQLIEMNLVRSEAAPDDKRKRLLGFTPEGAKLEQALRREQARLLQRVFDEMGEEAVAGWLEVNRALARGRQ
ncbi:MarR family transcriptional regulator [Pseudomonas sp. GOM7]|uniref:MarR family winged helix-turn-helix transcriptional regulator n=2 Tax=unclassified Pseudomonas TaxID=196821 RepID=UPI00227A21C8|nr:MULTISPECIES: MarR family transcriptional regulator [unclassified Pseudomonas]WAJ39689.1 MarR family transcriptional regulator [Pseudomonas sp. GOM7]